jgi:uncharacterized protein (DUF2236 family)
MALSLSSLPKPRFPLPQLLPTPTAVVAWALPKGLPVVRDELQARTGFGRSSLDRNGTPGDPGLFGPDSATWRLVGQPSMALAGLRAALLQSLSAPIPTATDSTGAFYKDFGGRVRRTGEFVQAQNLGSMDEVYKTARRVRAMHRTVKGTARDGLEFDASDPHQQAWVSMTLTESILVATERFGSGPLRRKEADQFVKEQATHGALLDHRVDLDAIWADPEQKAALQAGELPLPLIQEGELPTTRAGLEARMHEWTAELLITPLTRKLIDATVDLTEVPPRQRALIRPFILATLSTIPDDWHELLAPNGNRLEELVAAQAVQLPFALMQAAFGPSSGIEIARARVAAG